MAESNSQAREQFDQLHTAIMNIRCVIPPMVVDEQAYKLGHRDARHAAAELVSAAVSSMSAERDALRKALEAVIASRDKNSYTQERYVADGGFGPYWSPAASMVDSEAIAQARAALQGTLIAREAGL